MQGLTTNSSVFRTVDLRNTHSSRIKQGLARLFRFVTSNHYRRMDSYCKKLLLTVFMVTILLGTFGNIYFVSRNQPATVSLHSGSQSIPLLSSGSRSTPHKISTGNSSHNVDITSHSQRTTAELINEMRDRSRMIQQNCRKFGRYYQTTDDQVKVLYSAYRKNRPKFVYVPVAKCGWTSWNFILFEDAGKKDMLMEYAKDPNAAWAWATPYERAGMKIYRRVSEVHQLRPQVNESITFIRHPYKRLVSAYKNRVLQHERSWCPTKYHTLASKNVVITFPEAVQCIIDQGATSKTPLHTYAASKKITNAHYTPQVYLAQYCRMNYSLVADFEHYEENLNAIVEHLQIRTQKEHRNPSIAGLQLTDGQYMEKLTPEQLKQLEELYSVDFDIFGFDRSLDSL